jgi:two-component system, OmpR family, response regulator VicR
MTANGRQPHILVTNDTQEILDLVQELLEEEGYQVTTSLDLLNIDKIRALAPDLILRDLLFEGNQDRGWKMLHLTRLNPELTRIPVVLCTAAVQTVTNEEMAAQLERLRVRMVLKPFALEQLLGAVTEALAKRSTSEERTWLNTLLHDVETEAEEEPQDR